MGFWEVITPLAAVNQPSNPSGEIGTTGYAAVSGGTVASETTLAYWGLKSIKYTPTATTTDGISYAITLTAATSQYIKVWVWGALAIPFRLQLYDVTGAVVLAYTAFTGTGAWQKVVLSSATLTHTSHAIRVVKDSSASVAPFYLDGLNVIANGVSDTYVDGDQPGCVWDGTPHASTSRRLGSSAAGGAITNLADLNMYIDEIGGSGMPPMENIILPYGIVDGGYYQRSITRPRTFAIKGTATGSTYAAMHVTRAALIDTIKRDRVASPQPVTLRYNGAGLPVQIGAVYDSGLELTQWRGFIESIGIRFTAPDPYFYAEGDAAAALTAGAAATFAYIARRGTTEVWSDLSTAFNGAVYVITEDPINHILYIGGNFTSAGGVTGADNIVAYNPATGVFTALGVGCNSIVRAILVARSGVVYAGGDFTNAGTSGADYLAAYTPSTNTWAVVGSATALNDPVYALAEGSTGILYVGGNFTNAGGSGGNYIVSFLNGSWTALSPSPNARVRALVMQRGQSGFSGDVLTIGGDFTNLSTANGDYIIQYHPFTSAFTVMSTGMNALVRAITVNPRTGVLYIGGDFTTAGGTTVNYITSWNGAAFSAMGTGLTALVRALAVSPVDGSLWVGGDFTDFGPTAVDGLIVWTGTAWVPGDWDGSGMVPQALHVDRFGRPTLGLTTSGSAYKSGTTTITNNGGASALPKLCLYGKSCMWLINYTTGERFYTSLHVSESPSVVTTIVDFAAHTITDTNDGSLIGSVLAGADFGSWHLAPGVNIIGFGGASSAYLLWTERYWSCDR